MLDWSPDGQSVRAGQQHPRGPPCEAAIIRDRPVDALIYSTLKPLCVGLHGTALHEADIDNTNIYVCTAFQPEAQRGRHACCLLSAKFSGLFPLPLRRICLQAVALPAAAQADGCSRLRATAPHTPPPQLHIHGAAARKTRTRAGVLLHCTASCFRIAGRFQPSWDQGLGGR